MGIIMEDRWKKRRMEKKKVVEEETWNRGNRRKEKKKKRKGRKANLHVPGCFIMIPEEKIQSEREREKRDYLLYFIIILLTFIIFPCILFSFILFCQSSYFLQR